MNILPRNGSSAAVAFDGEDGIFVERIAGISDSLGFHGSSVDGLQAAFREAVDDYLATCATGGKTPARPCPAS